MEKKGPITGTFIDEITYDIPSSNWSLEQWRRDLDNMQEIGIDTVIFIRGGFEDKAVFPSKMLGNHYADDFAGFIFEETSKRNMDVFFGMYISDIRWGLGDAEGEIRKNKIFVDEVYARYSHYPSFKGWYIPQETCFDRYNIGEVMRGLSAICKDKTPDKKVFISPFFKTPITHKEDYFTPEQHYEEWDRLFDYGAKDIDICAFQDGTAPLNQLDDFYIMTAKLCEKYNIRHWVNTETFERDVRRMYYPIPFQLLRAKLEHHKKYAEKIITFEFSHFLSPQSIYPSAQNLNNLYKEYYLK
ncbi:MAG: DUF4434 domain-containing protein [Clostridia bacterium]|nr:DUF4434 domain-containing protein [Clostridia bacterium]